MTTKYTLSYFGIAGRAEPIRLAFAIGGIPFTNKAIAFPDFKDMKSSLPTGQLPILDIEETNGKNKVVGQSAAILRHVGKLAGLYPADDMEAMEVDMICDHIEDSTKRVSLTVSGSVSSFISDTPWTKEEVLAIRSRMLDADKPNSIPYYLNILEKQLETNNKKGWLVGDKPSIADLRAHAILKWLSAGILDGIPTDLLDKTPLLKALVDKVEAIPQVVAFRAKYGAPPYKDFDFVPPEN